MLSDVLRQLHLHTPTQQIGMAAVVATAVLAFWRGGRTEAAGATVVLVCWIITPFTQNLNVHLGPQLGILAIDAVLLAFLVALALRSARFWPLWAAGFHALGTVMHLGAMVDPQIVTRAYLTGLFISSYLLLGAIVAGTLLEANRRSSLRGTA
ncbi:hypothetical protein ABOZ73_12765 [Caulobacter sp. 73W]|uniref:Uncharacterized protein n=1 Tax=Caulobacter sp. 73W TaxID=3161137 RepID=A0AB39KQ03_9CAUL